MQIYSFNGRGLYAMLVGSTNMLAAKKNEINALNVFPVPDGDTGSNMYYTLLEGAREAARQLNDNIGKVAKAAAGGCLLGARGNSGVILSQIIAGFADAMAGREHATLHDVAVAFRSGLEKANKAIINPVEGTIITVCRELADAFSDAVGRGGDLVRATVAAHRRAAKVLEKTPDLLPVLKEAGVVDAGGKGLVVILEGFINALRDEALSKDVELFEVAAEQHRQFSMSRPVGLTEELEYTYCTEFILAGSVIPLETLREELVPYGDCLMVVGNDRTAKVHIHSNHPGLVVECGMKYGALKEIHINNMEEQVLETAVRTETVREVKPFGVVATGMGEGIDAILNSLGVDRVVRGGQTMNPSAQDLLTAVNETPADTVIILPNNKNAILAAEQARSLAAKEILVLPSHSVVQGINALMGLNPLMSVEENYARMQEAMQRVSWGEITRAVRDSSVNGCRVKKGEFMALAGDELVTASTDLETALEELVAVLVGEDAELVTLYFGCDIKETEAREIRAKIQRAFPDLDVEIHYGGQPLYHFMVSAE